MKIQTVNDIYTRTIGIPRPAVMKYKRDGRWIDISIPEFVDRVRNFSIGLRALGVVPEDRVVILSENRPEWTIADFAILAASAITVPIYPTLMPRQIEFLLQDSGAVRRSHQQEQLSKLLEIRGTCPALRTLILCDGSAPAA